MSYRLLGTEDTIRATDQYLNDDAETWSDISKEARWVVGAAGAGGMLLPFRRKIEETTTDKT